MQDAGHELRTPLTSLRTNVVGARRHDDLPAETRARLLDDLDAETRELTDLVNELVELATDARDDEPARARSSSARWSSGWPSGPAAAPAATIAVDGGRLRWSTAGPRRSSGPCPNLLDNAAKFDAPTAGRGTDRGGGAPAGRVEVRDRGPGIARRRPRPRLRPLLPGVGARSRPGSGLGLAIVRDIVESHGGSVSAANRPGGGAVVGFTLPLV